MKTYSSLEAIDMREVPCWWDQCGKQPVEAYIQLHAFSGMHAFHDVDARMTYTAACEDHAWLPSPSMGAIKRMPSERDYDHDAWWQERKAVCGKGAA